MAVISYSDRQQFRVLLTLGIRRLALTNQFQVRYFCFIETHQAFPAKVGTNPISVPLTTHHSPLLSSLRNTPLSRRSVAFLTRWSVLGVQSLADHTSYNEDIGSPLVAKWDQPPYTGIFGRRDRLFSHPTGDELATLARAYMTHE